MLDYILRIYHKRLYYHSITHTPIIARNVCLYTSYIVRYYVINIIRYVININPRCLFGVIFKNNSNNNNNIPTTFFTCRYNILFLCVTYIVPLAVMAVCYTIMGKELWGSKTIGQMTQRHMESIKSKRKVSIHFYLLITSSK